MTVKQIASAAATLLQADDIEAALDAAMPTTGGSGTTPATVNLTDPDALSLVACVNLAAAELAADGFPLVIAETLTATGGIIPLSEFSREPIAVKSVKSKGRALPFSADSRGVSVGADGDYAVCYHAAPITRALNEQADVGAMCDVSLVAYAVARNFCLMTGRYDEASIWDQRYAAEAEKRRLARRGKLPPRADFI